MLITFLFSIIAQPAHATPATMPFLGGKLSVAQANLVKFGFKVAPKILQQAPPKNTHYKCRAPVATDLVLTQDPAINTPVTADTQVTLTLICHLTTPQNSIVKKPYNPNRGKLKIPAKVIADQKKGIKTLKPTYGGKSVTTIKITCINGKKKVTISGTKPICPKGYKVK